MKTPAQFKREPGKLLTPTLRPRLPATPCGVLTTDYTDCADFSDRVFLAALSVRAFASFGAKAGLVAPRPPLFGAFSISKFGFVSDFEFRISDFRLCRCVHSWFPLDFIAPSSRQIAVNRASRPGAG